MIPYYLRSGRTKPEPRRRSLWRKGDHSREMLLVTLLHRTQRRDTQGVVACGYGW
jgi:hypothetical protein